VHLGIHGGSASVGSPSHLFGKHLGGSQGLLIPGGVDVSPTVLACRMKRASAHGLDDMLKIYFKVKMQG
jgi:hypothetical protein